MQSSPAAPSKPRFSYLDYREEQSVLIVQVNVALLNTDTTRFAEFQVQIQSLRRAFPHGPMVLDFSRVQQFTTDAFALVVEFRKTLERAGRKLVLCGLNDELRVKFGHARFLDGFAVCDDVESALVRLAA